MFCIDSDFAVDILNARRDAWDLMSELDATGIVHISSVCIFELTYSTRKMSKDRKLRLKQLFSNLEIIPLDGDAALLASDIGSKLAAKGLSLNSMDLLIGATALTNDLILVTRNIKHYSRFPGLRTESW